MANIALNKPSGGQLILSPEDGTSTETVTIPSVGVGKVLQVVEYQRAGGLGVSGSSLLSLNSITTVSNVLSKTITTKGANSKIQITLNAVGYTPSGDIRLGVSINRNGTQITGDRYFMYGSQSTMMNGSILYVDAPQLPAGSTITYSVDVTCYNTNTNFFGYADGGGTTNTSLIITEVAA